MTLAGTLLRLPFTVASNGLAVATALPRLVIALERLGEARPALDRLADAAGGLDQLSEGAPVLERLGKKLGEGPGPPGRVPGGRGAPRPPPPPAPPPAGGGGGRGAPGGAG